MKLYNRETSYYTIITIPKCLVSKYGKKQIWRSLNTKDYKLAKLRAELETMSIRRKLLNDLNKQKEKTSKALDFAQILDDDDDDFFEDDIDIKDTVDFSHYILFAIQINDCVHLLLIIFFYRFQNPCFFSSIIVNNRSID